MKSSKLLAETQLDIKIERGLKILQFASQHNIRKAFYRNCPLNSTYDQEEKANSKMKSELIKQNIENADILMDLNDQIANWERGSQWREKSIKHQGDPSKNNQRRATPQRSRNESHISKSSASSKSQSKEEIDVNDNSHQSYDDLSNYESQATRKKLKSIAEDPNERSSINIGSKIMKVNHSVIKSDFIRFSDLNSVDEYNDSSIRSQKSTKHKVEHVKKAIKYQKIDEPKFVKKPKDSHHYSSGAIDNSHQSSGSHYKDGKQYKKDSCISSKSSNNYQNSFLDRSISKIVSHSSQIRSKQQSNRSNITEFQLMRQLSSSFDDGENMKLLLKLENCELEQSYLERRIVNRLEKGYKEVNKILDLTWESLRLPRMQYGFIRPNYAHIIE